MKRFLITSQHDIFVDDFNEGELQNVNTYYLDAIIKAEDYKNAVTKYLQETVRYNLDIKNCEIEDNNIYTSCLVDSDNNQPTDNDVEQWKAGKKELYSNNIYITVSQIVPIELS